MKVLVISNSFGLDANRYLHQIGRAAGVTLDVTTLFIGGCPLDRHYRNMLSDQPAYDLIFNGSHTGFRVSLAETLLSNNQYDIITLQQASPKSPKYNTYQPYAQELYDYIKTCQPQAKILLHQTWAYGQGSKSLHDRGYETHHAMFADIEKSYGQCHEDLGTDGIIPSGKLMATLLESGIETVHRDNVHASLGLGRYALALLWFRMLTGRSVADNTFCDFDEPIPAEEIKIAKTVVDAFTPLDAEK